MLSKEHYLDYEALSDFILILLRLPYMNKRVMESLIKSLNDEYNRQKIEKKK